MKFMTSVASQVAVCLVALAAWTCQPSAVVPGGQPKLEFEKPEWDFGQIHDGDIVEHTFKFKNTGSDTLKIFDVHPSCGCTAALVSSSALLPGKTGEIKATFNSRGKRDKIIKTIVVMSNDTQNPRQQLTFTGFVLDPVKAHSTMSNEGSYFEGKCANCHVEKGIGKSGAELFAADCAMCHGEYGSGAVTAAINQPAYLKRTKDEDIYKMIADGSPKNPMMRGFSRARGGPLDEKQIQSLVDFIRSWQGAYQ